jgi:hypothetical protein
MSDDLRKLPDIVIGEAQPVYMSEAARHEAVDVSLSEQTWHTQPSFDPGRARFMFEHLCPVNALREACRKEESLQQIVLHLWPHIALHVDT